MQQAYEQASAEISNDEFYNNYKQASQKWKEAVLTTIAEDQKQQIINDLKEYCKMDTLAMCKIWECLTYL